MVTKERTTPRLGLQGQFGPHRSRLRGVSSGFRPARRSSSGSELLERLDVWMTRNKTAVMAVLLLIIGVKLVGDAISGFSA